MPVDNFRDDERERRLRALLMLQPTGQYPMEMMQDYSQPPGPMPFSQPYNPMTPLERALLELRLAQRSRLPLR